MGSTLLTTAAVAVVVLCAACSAGPRGAERRILCLGDSYTIGEGLSPDDAWPRQLAALARGSGLEVAEPVVVARTGWTTDELEAAVDAARPEGPFDLVTLMVGVNDQYRGRPTDEFRPGFARLLVRAVELAGADPSRVIAISIPDWGDTPFARARAREGIAAAIDEYNAVVREEAARRGVVVVDVTTLTRGALRAPDAEASLLVADGLHPSGAVHALWAAEILPAAARALGAPNP